MSGKFFKLLPDLRDMKNALFLLFILATVAIHAQTVRTDTVKPGYYIPFEKNYASCKVAITPNGGKVEVVNASGNQLPDTLIHKIAQLTAGSVVAYTEVTVLNNGVFQKAPGVRYVIGWRNSVYALRDPFLPDTLPAAEIAEIILDQHVYAFTLSYATGGEYFTFDHNGNGVAPNVKERVRALPSGTRVWFEGIKRREDDGSLTTAPSRIYVVK